MAAKQFTRGTTICVLVKISQLTPFGSYAAYSPDGGVTVTVTNRADDTIKVNNQSMTEDSTGRFYYNWSSSESDAIGGYLVEIDGADSGGNCRLVKEIIELVDVEA